MATTPKTPTVADDSLFTFEHDGETYTFEKPFSEVRTPRWLRANRRRDELDLAFTVLETLAGDEALAAIDTMDEDEFASLNERLHKELTATFR